MGKSKSEAAFKKLSKEMPPATKMGWDDNWDYKDVGMKVFADDKDRDQFIRALVAVASHNGLLDLDDHDFRLMYSRRGENGDRIMARVVALKDGVIKAKVEPEADGNDQAEAMRAFRRDVEVKLERLLQSIPSDSSSAGQRDNDLASPASPMPRDAPPAYTRTGYVGIMNHPGQKSS